MVVRDVFKGYIKSNHEHTPHCPRAAVTSEAADHLCRAALVSSSALNV